MDSQKSDPRLELRDLLRAADRAPAESQIAIKAALERVAKSAGLSLEGLREYAFGTRKYDFTGLAGCVVQRRSRLTGTLAGLYQAEQAGLDPEAGRWVTVCEDHGSCVNHETLAVARAHLADPSGWCEACREAHCKIGESS